MRKRHLFWPMIAVGGVVAGFTLGHAQQQQQAPFWYVSEYQVDFRMIDSLQRLLRTYTLPVVEEAKRAGNLLDEKWLIHHTASEFNVVRMRKFRTWDAINGDTSVSAANRRLFPDSTRRAAISSAFNGIFQAAPHRDAIYVEVVR